MVKKNDYLLRISFYGTIDKFNSKIEETDGLPMPKRIWAVVSVGFALCMSVLDINIVNIVLPTLSHDFGTSPAVTTWIINGYQLAIVISLLSFPLWVKSSVTGKSFFQVSVCFASLR